MKNVLMISLMMLTLTLSTKAFAVSNEEIISACLEAGKERLLVHAETLGCKMNSDEVEASAIDNRWYNLSKYVWYDVVIECPQSTFNISKMVQYYAGKCF